MHIKVYPFIRNIEDRMYIDLYVYCNSLSSHLIKDKNISKLIRINKKEYTFTLKQKFNSERFKGYTTFIYKADIDRAIDWILSIIIANNIGQVYDEDTLGQIFSNNDVDLILKS